ncbi:uncharacterized protein K460DRAFT_391810 [Cucurbitaria berberidis CBS 394.84]|uniref:Uncharacterized protein n=1 Tax=Cucurbitaria berberidis CBS 394.84 TaxID=1168544 RepID=A0A9P4GV32_9PLEO|nr:uncharacterized protein K460DRAFT_391810 [Cucurbitaria berberidis CBS 394.84]KAF1851561.1 hypothetical protein K460DRAFT_391810 [Cucurbitaria berberidis CBS 394.84]
MSLSTPLTPTLGNPTVNASLPPGRKDECLITTWPNGQSAQTISAPCSSTSSLAINSQPPPPAANSQPTPPIINSQPAPPVINSQPPPPSSANNGASTSVPLGPTQSNSSILSSSSPTGISKISKEGLSDGVVAGVAIGTFVAGLLIAGAIFFIMLRRQTKRQSSAAAYQMHHFPSNVATMPPGKGPTVDASAVASSIDDLLPQPVADETIKDELSKIRDNIKNHARTYYQSTPISVAGIHETGLRDLATATGVSPSALGSALSNSTTRQDALRLVLGWVVLSKTTGEHDVSLLPAELSRFVTSIPGRDGSDTIQSTLYSKWKTITGVLLHQRFGKNTPGPDRAQNFENIIAELDSVLAPFVEASLDSVQRHKNLNMILTRTANFAFLLFSQPGSFHFDFSSGYGGLIAFPALVQTISDKGQVLRPHRVLVEKEVAA